MALSNFPLMTKVMFLRGNKAAVDPLEHSEFIFKNVPEGGSKSPGRAVDPHSLYADPDPAVYLNADPDSDPGPDPDPGYTDRI